MTFSGPGKDMLHVLTSPSCADKNDADCQLDRSDIQDHTVIHNSNYNKI